MRTRRAVVIGAVIVLGLGVGTWASAHSDSAGQEAETLAAFPDFSVEKIARDAVISAMVPSDIAASGVLRVGAELTYPPMEMIGQDGVTPTGFSIDLAHALGNLMGLEVEIVDTDFDVILPAVGTDFDIGLSSFTVTPQRLEMVTMVSYLMAGSQLAAPAAAADPGLTSLCGLKVGVQYGTIQHDELLGVNEAGCHLNPVRISALASQIVVTEQTSAGEFDLMFADSPVVADAVARSEGTLAVVGPIINAAPYGIAVSPGNTALVEAVRAAVQSLMDSGSLAALAHGWGVESGVVTEAEVLAHAAE